jgi:hypothetical protein
MVDTDLQTVSIATEKLRNHRLSVAKLRTEVTCFLRIPNFGQSRFLRETEMRRRRFAEEQIIKVLKEHAHGLSARHAADGQWCRSSRACWGHARCTAYLRGVSRSSPLRTMTQLSEWAPSSRRRFRPFTQSRRPSTI